HAMPLPLLAQHGIRHILQMHPLPGLWIPSPTGGDDMQMRVVLAIATMRLDDPDIATLQGPATHPAEAIIQALHATAHERTQHFLSVLIKCRAQQRGHRQHHMTIDHPLMQHGADLAHPVIDIDFRAAKTQRRFTAHRDPMGAFPAPQAAVLNRAHRVRIAASEHLLHQTIIVARPVTRVGVGEPVPVLSKDLFEDVPRRRRCCDHQAASLSGMRLSVVARFYHILPTTSTPSAASAGDSPSSISPLHHKALRAIRKWKFLCYRDTGRSVSTATPVPVYPCLLWRLKAYPASSRAPVTRFGAPAV